MFQRLIIQIACLLFIGTSLLGQGKTWPHCKNPDGSIAVGAVMVQTGTTPSPWVCAICDDVTGTYRSVASGADLGIDCTSPGGKCDYNNESTTAFDPGTQPTVPGGSEPPVEGSTIDVLYPDGNGTWTYDGSTWNLDYFDPHDIVGISDGTVIDINGDPIPSGSIYVTNNGVSACIPTKESVTYEDNDNEDPPLITGTETEGDTYINNYGAWTYNGTIWVPDPSASSSSHEVIMTYIDDGVLPPDPPLCFDGNTYVLADSSFCYEANYLWTGDCAGGKWELVDYDAKPIPDVDVEMVYKLGFYVSYEATGDIVGTTNISNYSFEYFQYDEAITDPYSIATWTVAQSSADPTLDNYQVPNPDTSYLFRLVVQDDCGNSWEADIDDPTFSRIIHVNNNNSHNNTHVPTLTAAQAHRLTDYPATDNHRWSFYIYGDIVEPDAVLAQANSNYFFQGGSSITHFKTNSAFNGTFRVNDVENVTISGTGDEHILHQADIGAGALNCIGTDNLEITDIIAIGRVASNINGIGIQNCTNVRMRDVQGISEGEDGQSHGIRIIDVPDKIVLEDCKGITYGKAGAFYGIELDNSPRVILEDCVGACLNEAAGSQFGFGIYLNDGSNAQIDNCKFVGAATSSVQYGAAMQIGLSSADNCTVTASNSQFYGANTTLDNSQTGFNNSVKMRGSGSWLKAHNCVFIAATGGNVATIEVDPSTNMPECEFTTCTIINIDGVHGVRMQGGTWANAKIVNCSVEAPVPFFNTITPIPTTKIASNETY